MPLAVTTRKRSLPVKLGRAYGVQKQYSRLGAYCGPLPKEMRFVIPWPTIKGTQVTVSSGHPWRTRKARSFQDIGGDFFTQKQFYVGHPQRISLNTGAYEFSSCWIRSNDFVGDLLPATPTLFSFPPAIDSSKAQLNLWGTKAVALAKPNIVDVDLTTLVGESFQGLPKVGLDLLERGADLARKAGKDYLNLEFGWKPLIDDLAKISVDVISFEDKIRQWNRDVGRPVRRRVTLPSETSTEIQDMGNYVPFGGSDTTLDGPGVSRKSGSVIRTRSTEKYRWFSGEFMYFTRVEVDLSAHGISAYTQKARHLLSVLNLDITPESLWNLAPWSWAIDWFTSAGDVISNAQTFQKDGLFMRYGYLMEHTIVKDTYTRAVPSSSFIGSNLPVTSSFDLITETKTRTRANPFGFGINWSSLSPFQLSIAAALGLSRS